MNKPSVDLKWHLRRVNNVTFSFLLSYTLNELIDGGRASIFTGKGACSSNMYLKTSP